jgi:hypothetical protein
MVYMLIFSISTLPPTDQGTLPLGSTTFVVSLYCDSIKEYHQRNFVKVVYTNLRNSMKIEKEDVETALKYCIEYVMEVS